MATSPSPTYVAVTTAASPSRNKVWPISRTSVPMAPSPLFSLPLRYELPGGVGPLVRPRVAVPGLPVPDLQAVGDANHGDLLAEVGVLTEDPGHHQPPLGVE